MFFMQEQEKNGTRERNKCEKENKQKWEWGRAKRALGSIAAFTPVHEPQIFQNPVITSKQDQEQGSKLFILARIENETDNRTLQLTANTAWYALTRTMTKELNWAALCLV